MPVFPFLLPGGEGSDPSDPVQDTSVQAECTAQLAEQYKNKPNLVAYANFLGGRLQTLEDLFWSLLTLRWLSSAAGAQLDVIGKIVGQPRYGLGDADYLNAILARIAANASSGAVPDIYGVFGYILRPAQTMAFSPAEDGMGFEFIVGGAALPAPWNQIFLNMLSVARMAAVGGILRYLNAPPSGSFSFAAAGGGPGPGLGFNAGIWSSAYRS